MTEEQKETSITTNDCTSFNVSNQDNQFSEKHFSETYQKLLTEIEGLGLDSKPGSQTQVSNSTNNNELTTKSVYESLLEEIDSIDVASEQVKLQQLEDTETTDQKIEFTPSELSKKILTVNLQRKRFNLKTAIIFACLIVLTIAVFMITVCIWPSLGEGETVSSFSNGWLLQESKLPGIIVAAIGLSLGGYIVQQVTQNRLADTSILGISTVNIVLLVIVYVAGAGTTMAFQNAQPWVLMLVSICTGLLIFALSYKKRQNVSTKFVLAGIIINFLFVGFGNTFMNQTYANSPIFLLEPYMDGQLPLPSLTPYEFYSALAMVLFAFCWMVIVARRFFVSNSNYMIAKSLGVNPTSIYFQAIIIASIFTASAFILVGNITFLGIATGNIAFFLFKKKPISGLFGSVLAGALFMMFSYFVGNNCIGTTFVPPSELIPLIVAPIFILLALKKGR
ncbi:iron ABC transporter permease [Ureaplasma ceti]|uniref:Iron ABC transporter permease n=1 Tax=Ureaplasma ceti TaxID=3119530 RepID=A0ABP9U7T1_9BACT